MRAEHSKAKSAVDITSVERALSDSLTPLLQDRGFDTFERRTAWKHHAKRIDVLQIEFFNPGMQRKWGTTPYSFSLAAGCFFPFIPALSVPHVPKGERGLLLPDVPTCHVRTTPHKGIAQKECEIPNVWYVDPQGKYLTVAVRDARSVVAERILRWFDKFSDPPALLNLLLSKDERVSDPGSCWGFGKKESPVRNALTGFAALEVGQWTLAAQSLAAVLTKGGLSNLAGTNTIDRDLRRGIADANSKAAQ